MELYSQFYSFKNLFQAYKKARRHKTKKQYVINFEENQITNLFKLQEELITKTYKPEPLTTFILHDPKTRKINKSSFRDRIVHHALIQIIESTIEKSFILDSYANRKGKGTIKAIKRFKQFSRKSTKNYTKSYFVLKCDIKHYFESVDHNILLNILNKTIKDKEIIKLVEILLFNYKKGMPLGNLTSQFFANVYLNELDQYIKHNLKIKYYIRYVDDFIILDNNPNKLELLKEKINNFLKINLNLELHPEKSRIININRGIDFLGFKLFPYYSLIKKRNLRKFKQKVHFLTEQYQTNNLAYDDIYNFLEGWVAYTKQANTYNLRKNSLSILEEEFKQEISTKEVNRLLKLTLNSYPLD